MKIPKNQQSLADPFFIFGSARSGTSLLSRMLNNHSNLAVPYESHLYNTFYPLLKYYGNLKNEKNRIKLISDILKTDVMNDWAPRITLGEILSSITENSFNGIFEAVLLSWAKKDGKIRWGEKTPHHIDYWDVISEKWPNAKVIHIYRDGRDVALSLMNTRFGPKTIYAGAYYWKNYLNKVKKLKNKVQKNFIEISYEKLLSNPELELTRICSFLDEDYQKSILEFHKSKVKYKTDDKNEKNLMKPLIRNNIEKWPNKISNYKIRIFESIAGNDLKEYGYKLKNSNPTISTIEHFYWKLLSLIKRMFSMLKNTKGHKDAFIILVIKIKLLLTKKQL